MPEETRDAERRIHGLANSALTARKDATASALAASREAWTKAAELQREGARSHVAQRIAGLGRQDGRPDQASHRDGGRCEQDGIAKAAKIGRETVLPELGRTGAKVRERTRPERLEQDYREFLIWLHENVLDYAIETLFFVPTKGRVALEGLTVRGGNRASGHDYRPSPYFVFEWALSAVDEDFSRFSFVDYGAGKGRVLLLASQHPFTAVGGIEFAEELHDDATMNIAQFPRSRMKCRNVECVLDDAVKIGAVDGDAVHYFFNPFSPEVFAEVLNGIVASYHEHPRRLYLILIDHGWRPSSCRRLACSSALKLPLAERLRAQAAQPLQDHRLPLARLTRCREAARLLHAELLLQARRRGGVLEDQLLVRIDIFMGCLRHQRRLMEAGQDELQLAGIGVDVADGEDARLARLELRGVDGNEILVEIEAPIGDRPELHGETEEGHHDLGRLLEGRAVGALHRHRARAGRSRRAAPSPDRA